MNKRILLIFSILLVLSSCKKEILPFNFTEKKRLKVTDLDFEYFQAKSKINFDDGIQNFKSTAHIRIKKDSIIWISVTPAIGVEAIRAVIRQDSVFIVDRLNKKYSAYGIDSLQTKYNIPFDFDMLQSALLGNLIHKREREDKVTKDEGYFVLRQKNNTLLINNIVNSRTMKVEKVTIIDEQNENSMDIKYDNFQFVSQKLIPHDNVFQITYKKIQSDASTEMNIAYNRISMDNKKIKFPFSVPNKYVSNE